MKEESGCESVQMSFTILSPIRWRGHPPMDEQSETGSMNELSARVAVTLNHSCSTRVALGDRGVNGEGDALRARNGTVGSALYIYHQWRVTHSLAARHGACVHDRQAVLGRP